MTGLENDKVLVVEHDLNWQKQFRLEAENLTELLVEYETDIRHFGSTSVPGLKAKPVVDILVGLESFNQIGRIIPTMKKAGYIYAHWAGIPNDYTFIKGDSILSTHLIHIVVKNSPNWNLTLAFRDALRKNPELACKYQELKEDLVDRYPDSREKYTEGKTGFITSVLNESETSK